MSRKLLIVSQRFWPEETDINTIARCFAANGIKVDVLCGKPNYPEGRFYDGYGPFGKMKEDYEGINVYRCAEFRLQGAISMRPLLNYISFAVSGAQGIRSLKKNQYDAVFIYQTSPVFQARAALKLAYKRRIRSVMYVRDLWPDAAYKEFDIKDPLLKKLFKAISYRQYKKAGRLIACCRDAERFLVREIARTPSEVAYIPPFASEKFSRVKRIDRITQRFMGSFNLLYIGRVDEDGPFDIFLEAMDMLIGAGLRDIRIIIAGGGSGLADLKKKVDKLFLYDNIFIEGDVGADTLPGYIYAADVLLCADNIDAAVSYKPPKQIIDYLGCAKPILAAADGQGKEIIRNARCGMVSDPEDARSLYEAILALYKTPKEELKKMGDNAKLYQLKNFDCETCIEKMLEIIFPS